MRPIEFPEQTHVLAKDQPQYTPLPVHIAQRTVTTADGEKTIPWSATCCYELTDEDIADIVANRKMYYQQMLFGYQFQPVFLSTKDPFVPENKQHWPAE